MRIKIGEVRVFFGQAIHNPVIGYYENRLFFNQFLSGADPI